MCHVVMANNNGLMHILIFLLGDSTCRKKLFGALGLNPWHWREAWVPHTFRDTFLCLWIHLKYKRPHFTEIPDAEKTVFYGLSLHFSNSVFLKDIFRLRINIPIGWFAGSSAWYLDANYCTIRGLRSGTSSSNGAQKFTVLKYQNYPQIQIWEGFKKNYCTWVSAVQRANLALVNYT